MLVLTPRARVPVEINFKSRKLAKVLNEEARLVKEYGAKMARKIRTRLAVLVAMPNLDMVPRVPPERCHRLKGDFKGCYALDVEHPFRIVIEPDHDPLPTKADGGLDLARVTAVTILDILDYH